MHNQLICYKKIEHWDRVINTAEEILAFVPETEVPEVKFELGYALLRYGETREAIRHLKVAAQLIVVPEHYYWLAEAYFASGDLIRALYNYQKIIDLFSDEPMWPPTVQYKTGIVLEFMGEVEEARKVYEELIKQRGIADIWGAEAQKRLEELE